MAGATGGIFIAQLLAYLLETTDSFVPIFSIAALA
jgi:hypoxanthine phosphoribosyltransferase